MKNFIILIVISVCFTSCKKPFFASKDEGILKDFSGLAGCGWVIELDSSSDEMIRFELTNLSDFDIEPRDGMSVKFKYRELDQASNCMIGSKIELTRIKEN